MTELPLICAPGLMCDDFLFENQRHALGESRRVAMADFSHDETITAMAERLLAHAPLRFVLAGLSMGGIVAFEVWRQAPERVAGLVLMNTTPFADSPARKATRRDQIARVRQGALRTVVMEELKPNYLGSKTKQDREVLEAIAAMADRLGPEVFVRQSNALMARAESTPTLPTITCPSLIIAGEEDEVCPPELHEIMHEAIPDSRYFALADCGHLSTLEAADEVNGLMLDFFKQIEGKG